MTADACRMRVKAFSEDERQCSASPTVGGNGLYRYCARHMRQAADAGATTLVWDEPENYVRKLSPTRA